MMLLLQTIALGIFIYMVGWYAISLLLKDASIVDIAWGIGFVVVALFALRASQNPNVFLMVLLVLIWAVRLSGHILQRKLKNPAEDFRYAAWRKDWGANFYWRSFLQVFMLQGVVLFIIAIPLPLTTVAPNTVQFSAYLGALVWAIGFCIEAVADWQLDQFKQQKTSKGTLLTTGLWRYSRHPNYFGESVQWWGIWIISLASPLGIYAIVSPITITLFLRFVSGVPMLEKKYAGRKDFAAYKKQTNAFVLWFTKN